MENLNRREAEAGRGRGHFWSKRQNLLRKELEPVFFDALRAGDLEMARIAGAEYHYRLEDMSRAQACGRQFTQSEDAQMLVGALPVLKRGIGAKGSRRRSSGESMRSAIEEALYVEWDLFASENLGYLRIMALADERDQMRGWVSYPSERIFDDLDPALRCARADIHAAADNKAAITVDVRLGFEAFQEFRRRHRIHDVYTTVEQHLETAAVAHLHAQIDGRMVQVRALHRLMPGPWMGEETANDMVSSRLQHADGDLDFRVVWELDLDDDRAPVSEWEQADGLADLPVKTPDEALGSGACTHEGAHWRQLGADLVLSCGACFNPRVARVPAHRCPPDHLLHRDLSEQEYLEERHFSDAVHGRTLDINLGLDDLRRRDGFVSMDPKAYPDPLSTGRRGPSVRSVAAAMNRR